MATTEKGFKYAKLICVAAEHNGAALNNNKVYEMRQLDASSFEFAYGRVGQSLNKGTKPMSQWDKVYKDKTNKKGEASYKDVTHLFTESANNSTAAVASNTKKYEEFKSGRPAAVKDFVKLLQSYAKGSVKANYTVEAANVTQAQVDEAQSILNEVASHAANPSNIGSINKTLLELFSTIPRKMVKVQHHLVDVGETDLRQVKTKLNAILVDEQKTLDVMAGQVRLAASIKNIDRADANDSVVVSDMLDAAGLGMELITGAEEAMIRNMMSRDHQAKFKRAFRVTNKATQKKYDANLSAAREKKTELFWHGSRSENWWSIASNGLLIRPSSAVYSGSMFSDGVYFASSFGKSLGYTSYSGSRWAGGTDTRGFLALYQVHVGKQLIFDRHTSECYSLSKTVLQKKGGYDSTWARAGVSLMNDEFIIYDPCQCTIKYLIEIN